MIHHDYNGTGKWTVAAVQARHAEYAARLGMTLPPVLSPRVYVRGETKWTFPIMETVIEGIRSGDPACSIIGVEFIEEDGRFRFGRILKSNAARALRQSRLSNALTLRIRHRVVGMLLAGHTPREFREYAKLLRKVGFEDFWPRIEARIPRENKYAMRYFDYLRSIKERAPETVRSRAGTPEHEA